MQGARILVLIVAAGGAARADFSCTVSRKITFHADLPGGMHTESESEVWYSRDVPGAQDLRAYYKRRVEAGMEESGGRSGIQAAMAELQKRLTELDGVPLLIITRSKISGGDAKLVEQMNSALGETTEEWSAFSTNPIPDTVFAIPTGFAKTP